MALTKVTYSMIEGACANVLDFGALGNGVSDDTAAIQAAIDSVATNGGTVLFPAGKTYVVATSLSVLEKSSVCLVGEGNATAGAAKGTILKFTAASGARLIDARSSYGFKLQGFYIWQSNASFSGYVVDLGWGASNSDSAFAIIKENIFSAAGAVKHINITRSITITVSQNNFAGGARAIFCNNSGGDYANAINVNGNQFIGQSSAPVYNGGAGSQVWNINDNIFEALASGSAGAFIATGLTSFSFSGNYCGDANTLGSWFVLSGGVSAGTITNNLFATGGTGIYLEGASTNQGLTITSNCFSGIATADVYIVPGHLAYADIHNNFHYSSASSITGFIASGRYQTSAAGANYWRNTVQLSGAVPNGVGGTLSDTLWGVISGGVSNIPLAIRASAGQTANLFEARNSSDSVIARIRANGGLQIIAPEPIFYAGDFINTSATQPYGVRAIYTGVAGGTGMPFFIGEDTTVRFHVLGNGNVENVNNSYGALSDARLKQNIADCTPKLDALMGVRVVNYEFKHTPGQKQLGVVAQELEQIFPGMVDTRTDKNGEETKSVKYSVFVPMLIKAVQELKSELDSLKRSLQT